jgi:hypothetical protein
VCVLKYLLKIIVKTEPYNAALFYKLAQPIVRLSGRKEMYFFNSSPIYINFLIIVNRILEQTLSMVSKAIDLDSSKSEYNAEMGYILLLLGENNFHIKAFVLH